MVNKYFLQLYTRATDRNLVRIRAVSYLCILRSFQNHFFTDCSRFCVFGAARYALFPDVSWHSTDSKTHLTFLRTSSLLYDRRTKPTRILCSHCRWYGLLPTPFSDRLSVPIIARRPTSFPKTSSLLYDHRTKPTRVICSHCRWYGLLPTPFPDKRHLSVRSTALTDYRSEANPFPDSVSGPHDRVSRQSLSR